MEKSMEILLDLVTNHMIIAPVVSWLICQFLKVIITFCIEKEWRWERMFGDGGMPSAHSATVVSLAVMAGYLYGLGSAVFAVTVIFAAVVMHDATGVRRETGKQAMTILFIIDAINDMAKEKDRIVQNEKLKTFVGHTPVQVFFGAVAGIVICTLYILVFHITGVF